MNRELSLQNRQRARAVDLRLLRRITLVLLADLLSAKHFTLGVHLVAAPEMAQLNETFLEHAGPTDVITFDHSTRAAPGPPTALHGEIFICVDEVVVQARRFSATWQSELVRCLVHGLLHLYGHDDTQPGPRKSMKRKENSLLKQLASRFPLSKLRRQPKVAP